MTDGLTPREAAAAVLERAAATAAPVALFLADAEERVAPPNRALLRELVLGSLRWRLRLDDALASAAGRPFERFDHRLVAPLRIGAYQLLFLDRVPAHAAVDEAVRAARRRAGPAGAGFVNAVLRRLARSPRLADWPVGAADPVRRLAIETSHPELLVRRWLARFGAARTAAALAANNRPKPLHLLAFRAHGGRGVLASVLAQEGVETEFSALAPEGLVVRAGEPLHGEAFRRGLFYVEDEAGQAAALLPAPRPGERILDIAAAPGGKSLALLAFEPRVRLLAADLAPARLGRLAANRRRLGLAFPVVAADAVRPPFAAGGFDRVVVDLPCTGTGTLRKHPELKWRIRPAEIRRLAAQGRRLAAAALELVAPGGVLALITCSLEPEENEELASGLLAGARGDLAPEDLTASLPAALAGGIEGPGRWRVLPAAEHDGFTVHVLRRNP